MIDEPRRGLVVARETGRRHADATCWPTSMPIAACRSSGSSRMNGGSSSATAWVALSGPFRLCDLRGPAGRGHSQGDSCAERGEHRLPSASPDDAAIEIRTCYLWEHRERGRRTWSMSGRPPTATTCSRSPASSTIPMSPTAIFTKRSTLLVEDPAALREALGCDRRALRDNVTFTLMLYRNGSWAA